MINVLKVKVIMMSGCVSLRLITDEINDLESSNLIDRLSITNVSGAIFKG